MASKVIVLGGSGAVGRAAVRALAAHEIFDAVIAADIETDRAEDLAEEIGGKVTAAAVDAGDAESVRQAVSGCQVALNCAGPFYRFERPTLEGVIQAGAHYVDVCDDVDATLDLLALDGRAREAGVRALIGMGNSPGVTNLLARYAADQLLDEVDSVDVYHAHHGEPFESEGVIAHRFHGINIGIPMYLDGQLRTVRFFEPAGVALRERVDFPGIGRNVQVYPFPHPEQITLPRHIRLRRVTNRDTVLPDEYFQLTIELARLGLGSLEPVAVKGRPVVPYDFAIAWLGRRRQEILTARPGPRRGCTKVVVAGQRRGRARRYEFSMPTEDQALGEITGIRAAAGAILMAQGRVGVPGVRPPEAAVNPLDYLELIRSMLAASPPAGSFEGVRVEKIDDGGRSERMTLPM